MFATKSGYWKVRFLLLFRIKLITALFCAISITAHAQTRIVGGVDFKNGPIMTWIFPKQKAVTFTAIGKPGFLRINGTNGYLEGKVEGTTGTFSVDLTKIKTGVSLRDEHMHAKYLDTKKFPLATLTVTHTAPITSKAFDFKAALTIKGVTKSVEGWATLHGKKLFAEFIVPIEDYPIGVPSWLGVSVARDVVVNVSAVSE